MQSAKHTPPLNGHLPQPIKDKDYPYQPITEQVTTWVGPVRQGHKHRKHRHRSLVDCGLSRQPRRHIGTVNSLGPFKKLNKHACVLLSKCYKLLLQQTE